MRTTRSASRPRSRRPTHLSLARSFLRAVCVLSGSAGGVCAELAFRRPPRFRSTRPERDLLGRGAQSFVRGPLGEIAIWHWGSGPPVLLTHGWGSQRRPPDALREAPARRGIRRRRLRRSGTRSLDGTVRLAARLRRRPHARRGLGIAGRLRRPFSGRRRVRSRAARRRARTRGRSGLAAGRSGGVHAALRALDEAAPGGRGGHAPPARKPLQGSPRCLPARGAGSGSPDADPARSRRLPDPDRGCPGARAVLAADGARGDPRPRPPSDPQGPNRASPRGTVSGRDGPPPRPRPAGDGPPRAACFLKQGSRGPLTGRRRRGPQGLREAVK